jgi:hypothetical protein
MSTLQVLEAGMGHKVLRGHVYVPQASSQWGSIVSRED